MQTLEDQFNTRVNAFPEETGMSPTTLGMRAVGDPNLMRQIAGGRSPSLRTADRVLAFIADHGTGAGGTWDRRRAHRRRRHPAWARKTRRSRAMTKRQSKRRTKPAPRFLRVSEVEARTGLSRSTIYDWSAEGRFPPAIRLSKRAMRWVEAEGVGWLSRRWASRPKWKFTAPPRRTARL
ncbi:helix-turn-helix transcriptional regulator [Candidatus Palauibacter sp.]|uniref:helix-turn-helix transcriptional regulator n=2 Tax=Candidatus Palauibacter sp. TaxID=3101350 RepID=UPI003AF2F8BB